MHEPWETAKDFLFFLILIPGMMYGAYRYSAWELKKKTASGEVNLGADRVVLGKSDLTVYSAAGVKIIDYQKIQWISVRYAMEADGGNSSWSYRKVELVITVDEEEPTSLPGNLLDLNRIAGELRNRVRALEPSAEVGDRNTDRQCRLDQKQARAGRERIMGIVGMVICFAFLLCICALNGPYWFAATTTRGTIVRIVESPKEYSIEYAFNDAEGNRHEDKHTLSHHALEYTKKTDTLFVEYSALTPKLNRLRGDRPYSFLTWVGLPCGLILLLFCLLHATDRAPA